MKRTKQLAVAKTRIRPPSGVAFQPDVGYAHELVHGLAALSFTIKEAMSILERPLDAIWPYEWEDLQDYVRSIACEIAGQQFDAVNLIASRWPSFAHNLYRPCFQRISPWTVLAEMLPLYQYKATQRDIKLEEPATVPAMPAIDLEIYTVRRAFHNLLSNALKYSYSGNEDRHRFIRLSASHHRADGNAWKIQIQNYGVGIEQDERDRVFEPGYRGRLARADNTFGSGLGLGQARHCIRLHGGELKIVSELLPGGIYLTTASVIFEEKTSVQKRLKEVLGMDRS